MGVVIQAFSIFHKGMAYVAAAVLLRYAAFQHLAVSRGLSIAVAAAVAAAVAVAYAATVAVAEAVAVAFAFAVAIAVAVAEGVGCRSGQQP